MGALAKHDLPPEGYTQLDGARGSLVVADEHAASLAESGFSLTADGDLGTSDLHGRRPLFELETSSGTFVVRRFSHGGLMRWLTGTRFLDPTRPLTELVLAERLRASGIATARVVAARALKYAFYGWQLEVMTERIPDSIDLGFVHALRQRGELSDAACSRILEATGAFIRSLHDIGFLHADLCPNNILLSRSALTGGAVKLWTIDLDRSEFVDGLPASARRRNLHRLYRHVRRREDDRGHSLRRTDFLRFLRGYDPTRERWRGDWDAIRALHKAGGWAHRTGWLLERIFGRGRDPRAMAVEYRSVEADSR